MSAAVFARVIYLSRGSPLVAKIPDLFGLIRIISVLGLLAFTMYRGRLQRAWARDNVEVGTRGLGMGLALESIALGSPCLPLSKLLCTQPQACKQSVLFTDGHVHVLLYTVISYTPSIASPSHGGPPWS
jgi:hypothetical protein